jgi:hypothetical protein
MKGHNPTSMKTFVLITIGLFMSCIGPISAQGVERMAGHVSQHHVSCEEATRNAPRIKVGMKEAEVLALVGVASERSAVRWDYDFTACARPPRAGEQIITGMSIFFREGTVRDVHWDWVDATGPGRPLCRISARVPRLFHQLKFL